MGLFLDCGPDGQKEVMIWAQFHSWKQEDVKGQKTEGGHRKASGRNY